MRTIVEVRRVGAYGWQPLHHTEIWGTEEIGFDSLADAEQFMQSLAKDPEFADYWASIEEWRVS